MKRLLIPALCLGAFAGCSTSPQAPAPMPAPVTSAPVSVPTLPSGLDLEYVDPAIRVQDDTYRHLNEKWLENFQIPADKSIYGSFTMLDDSTKEQLRKLVDSASADTSAAPGTSTQKIRDLYNSFMDEATLEKLGASPLKPELARIEKLKDKKQIMGLMAHLEQIGVRTPLMAYVDQDAKDSSKYVAGIDQSGLGLPDRDYYLKDDDAKLKAMRESYETHVTKMLTLLGDADAASEAKAILKLETAIARAQWTKVELRDPVKTYNPYPLKKLPALAHRLDWKRYLVDTRLDGKVDYLVVSAPSYVTGLDAIVRTTPLSAWKAYFRWHLLSESAPYLSKAFVDENFAFYGTVLRGQPQNTPRWKRGIDLVDESVGEMLGQLYVKQYFPPASKARMEQLVANLQAAYRGSIDTLDWMTPATKKAAQEKLSKFTAKVGYPNKWRDYTALTISATDLVGNVTRAQEFDYNRDINKLGKPIDREEWGMTPQTINAGYNPAKNEIVFPAAILQPPFFNANADDAVNYGGIGAVIGHEMSHGYDDEGSQYDGDGNLRDWWTPADHAAFKKKTEALVAQYAAYSPVPGYPINGELTLGENIADNSGLAIAYKAYELSLGGKKSPVIDGMTGEQRLYYGWAQVWRGKAREPEAIRRVKSDPHSPPAVRGTAPLRNQPGFYDAFDVKEGDKMWLAPDQRVIMW